MKRMLKMQPLSLTITTLLGLRSTKMILRSKILTLGLSILMLAIQNGCQPPSATTNPVKIGLTLTWHRRQLIGQASFLENCCPISAGKAQCSKQLQRDLMGHTRTASVDRCGVMSLHQLSDMPRSSLDKYVCTYVFACHIYVSN